MPDGERGYSLRPALPEDAEFACDVKLHGLRPHVEAFAPWHEERQRESFLAHYDHRTTRIIQRGGEDVGVLRVLDRGAQVHLAEIYLRPEARNVGLGSRVVRDVVGDAHARGRGVTLQLLRTNPVVRLYQRLGFRISGETHTHFLMESPCPGGRREESDAGPSQSEGLPRS